MSLIEPVRKDVQHPKELKKYSALLRSWHWANFIIISGSLITVLINATITDQHNIGSITKAQLTKAGLTVPISKPKR